MIKQNKDKIVKEVLKEMKEDYKNTFSDISFWAEKLITKAIKLTQKKTKKLMYDYYFKKFKNPVIIERKEFERLGALDNGK